MKILNILAAGQTGGIEVLCKNIVLKSKEDNRICCLFEEGEICEYLKSQGVKVFSTKKLHRNIWKIAQFLESYCIDQKIDTIIIHHGGMLCNLIYLILIKKLKNIKFVRYLHGCFDEFSFGNDGNWLKRLFVRKIMKKALESSNLIIYISEAVKRSFEKRLKIKNCNSVIIYNGIPNEFFGRKLEKTNNEYIQFSYIGRLAKLKGVNLLIDAFDMLYKENKDIRLNIVGEGEEEKNLKKQVENLHLNNVITFCGRKKDVIPILDKTEIFVYPSICEEGFGISVIEAMSRKCIPITFKKGGIPEIISDGTDGFLVNRLEDIELKKVMEKVISLNDLEKTKIKEQAREKSKQFSIDNTINKLEFELHKMMEK